MQQDFLLSVGEDMQNSLVPMMARKSRDRGVDPVIRSANSFKRLCHGMLSSRLWGDSS